MALVYVQITDERGRPMDGTVRFVGPTGAWFGCRTTASRCTLRVQDGTYTVTVSPVRGRPPAPRKVVVGTGTQRLVFRAATGDPHSRASLAREVARLRVENLILRDRIARCLR